VTTVTLTPLRSEDSSTLFEWINHRELVIFNAPFRPITREEHDRWFDQIRQREDVRIFGIREDERLVGSCQLHSIHPAQRSAELQIRIGVDDARGRGVGREVLQQLLCYGFDELDLHRIHLHVLATNERAIRFYEHAGFRREGVLRQAALIDGAWVDVLLMAMLRTERG
jgi:UDP-4-amino-4,6-dideoxy-N-acetyl-beta-L-altrosamine N-acetyltransferase